METVSSFGLTLLSQGNNQEDTKALQLGTGARGKGYVCTLLAVCCLFMATTAFAGMPKNSSEYKVLPAITHGSLAIFPVLGSQSHDTSRLITLDEGIRSGEVTVTEAGGERGLVRPGVPVPPPSRAEVNRLVLYNNSNRPLLLLAGEIVTGGKQDRVIGSDIIVPPNTGPVDLSVFCVEPGRWVASSDKFGSMGAQMAQPSVRTPAMVEKNQSKVWDNVGAANRSMASAAPGAGSGTAGGITSYAKVFESAPVQKKIAEYGGPEQEQTVLRELRSKGAVGVVIAVNGRLIWADIFASTDLLAKYWTKLFKSYVAEAVTSPQSEAAVNLHDAQVYIDNLNGGREVVETEPGVYRRADITGDGYRVFELTSLLPKAEFEVHITKMKTRDDPFTTALPRTPRPY